MILALSSAVLLISCASAPVKSSEEDCLVVIPTRMVNETGQMFARNYYLQFSDQQREQLVPQHSTAEIVVVVKRPGVKITGVRSVVDVSKNFQGPDARSPLNVELPYVPGGLVIAGTGFELRMVKVDSTNYSSVMAPFRTDKVSEDKLWNKYQAKKEYASWFAD